MAAKNKSITKCRFYAITGKLHFECKKCGTRWWTVESGRFRCTECRQWMVVDDAEIKKRRKPAKSVLFFNNNSTWKKTIKKYLGG